MRKQKATLGAAVKWLILIVLLILIAFPPRTGFSQRFPHDARIETPALRLSGTVAF